MVIACSDGRLQEATDNFLDHHLGITRYDRLYLPGGAGALAPSNREFLRAQGLRRECKFLVESHSLKRILLLFHGPAADGPEEAMCADYRRKLPWSTVPQLRDQQAEDARELVERRTEWAGTAQIDVYRCEVSANGEIAFADLNAARELAARMPGAHDGR